MGRAQPPLANTVTLGVRDFDAQRNRGPTQVSLGARLRR